jgi:hypothetical protein
VEGFYMELIKTNHSNQTKMWALTPIRSITSNGKAKANLWEDFRLKFFVGKEWKKTGLEI